MKLVLSGREYPVDGATKAQLIHLIELQQGTRSLVPPNGIGIKALRDMDRSARARLRNGERPEDLPDDALLSMGIVVFLARRAAGDRVSFVEACSVPLDDVDVVHEPGDEAADISGDGTGEALPELDPTAYGDGAQLVEHEASELDPTPPGLAIGPGADATPATA